MTRDRRQSGPTVLSRGSGPDALHCLIRSHALRTAGAALVLLLSSGTWALAGHSLGHYPSYYPDEIRVEQIDPKAAAERLEEGTIQAYVGETPSFGGAVPDHVTQTTSLRSFLVVDLKGAASSAADRDRRCVTLRGIAGALREETIEGFVFHPYPVTSYHADYLHHLDRVDEAIAAVAGAPPPARSLRIAAMGRLAEKIAPSRWTIATGEAQAVLVEMPVEDLFAQIGAPWRRAEAGPPWAKEGWFQAYRLLMPPSATAGEPVAEETPRAIYERLIRGEAADLAERANLERQLVAALTGACERLVVGYSVRREYANNTFGAGIENVAYDSQRGLNAPIFLRTAKLKDYPWNGSLHLGVSGRPEAAWNPVAGFTDSAGRLLWSAVGDPAMIAFPDNSSWIPNRVQFTVSQVHGQSGGLRVPPDAVRPRPGTATLEPVGAHVFASAKVVYEVLASPFLDGSEMTMADLLYPLAFAHRWGGPAWAEAPRDRLVGVRALRVESTINNIAPDLDVVQNTPVIEVYLREAPGDEHQVAAIAPPWSTVPWHLLVLMEEAVSKGYAAFSREEARRLGVGWLDLARDEALRKRLFELTSTLEREQYRPEALKGLVTAEEARQRWHALAAFGQAHGHFLVTNGPYRLKEWGPDSFVLQAVREATYPLGFGAFDRYVNPPRAVIRDVRQEPDRVVVSADAELTVKAERRYRMERQPLTQKTSHGLFGLLVVSRYLLIGSDGIVLDADKMDWQDDGTFSIRLPEHLQPGRYTLLIAIFLDGNSVHPSTRAVRVHVNK